MAFIMRASGMDRHGNNSAHPMAYTHVDIAGSAIEKGNWASGRPTGTPVVAFAMKWFV